MYEIITEGKAKIHVPVDKKISRKLPVFYNPLMKLNRDISVFLLNSIGKSDLHVGLPLAGTGVRGIRLLLESEAVSEVVFNDHNTLARDIIKKNLKKNKLECQVINKDANMFLMESCGFDYIDIDPFGSPNPFLDIAVNRLSRRGILAVTATDLAALCGSYANVCRRKYWAEPVRDSEMHETGLRILIRKVQLVGAQYDRALVPVYSYYKNHYFRVFFQCTKSKTGVDAVIKKHGFYKGAGPLFLGALWDTKLAEKMSNAGENIKLLNQIKYESKVDSVGFFDMHSVAKELNASFVPQKQKIIDEIRKQGNHAFDTHFLDTGVKSNVSKEKFLKIFNQLLV